MRHIWKKKLTKLSHLNYIDGKAYVNINLQLMHVLQMWETSVRYFEKSIRIIRPIRGREKEYEHQWFNLTTDIADLADKILTKEKTTAPLLPSAPS